jgi:hypothetical protein
VASDDSSYVNGSEPFADGGAAQRRFKSAQRDHIHIHCMCHEPAAECLLLWGGKSERDIRTLVGKRQHIGLTDFDLGLEIAVMRSPALEGGSPLQRGAASLRFPCVLLGLSRRQHRRLDIERCFRCLNDPTISGLLAGCLLPCK